ncbi:MAG: DUF2061 domain-containing protein [Halanaeroarchaeum sp.]
MTRTAWWAAGIGAPDRGWWESLVKALVYRLFMVVLTVIVAFVVTTDSVAALQIGVATNVLKTGTYYAYERLWERFRAGRWSRGDS